MINRFKTAAGFLAAATLLSGSAFAFAPQFSEDLPPVTVTNQDDEVPETSFLFRFTGAYNLLDFIEFSGTDATTLDFQFNEFLIEETEIGPDGLEYVTPSSVPEIDRVWTINDTRGLFRIPEASDFETRGIPAGSGTMNFRSLDYSGLNPTNIGPFSQFGFLTGEDITQTRQQQRVITLYIKDENFPMNSVDLSSFVATVGIADDFTQGLTGPLLTVPLVTDPFETFLDFDSFGDWGTLSLTEIGLLPGTGGTGPSNSLQPVGSRGDFDTGITYTPDRTVVAAGGSNDDVEFGSVPGDPSEVSMSLAADRLGLIGFNLGIGVSGAGDDPFEFEAGRLYQARTRVVSNSETNPTVRTRLGSGAFVGETNHSFNPTTGVANNPQDIDVPRIGTTPRDFYTHVLAKDTGTGLLAVEFVGFGDPDLFSGAAGVAGNLTLLEAEIGVADLEDLGSGQVLLNQGGSVTLASGEIGDLLPSESPDPFVINPDGANEPTTSDASDFGQVLFNAIPTGINTNANLVTDLSSTQLRTQFPGNANVVPDFTSFGFAPGADAADNYNLTLGAPATIQVSDDKLYLFIAFVSTDTAVDAFPSLRIRATTNITNEAFMVIQPDTAFGQAGLTTSGSRAYVTPFVPQLGDESTGETALFFDVIRTAATPQTASVEVNRLVVWEFDAPWVLE